MIRIACTNCKTVLSIDDAFAGGVCRCQHCGTIQTVPAKARGAAAASTTTVTAGSKALFQHNPKSDGASSGTGLDELAGIVASSGLSGSGLRSRRLTTPASGPGSRRNRAAIFITVAVVIVVGGAALSLVGSASAHAPAPQLGTSVAGVPYKAVPAAADLRHIEVAGEPPAGEL